MSCGEGNASDATIDSGAVVEAHGGHPPGCPDRRIATRTMLPMIARRSWWAGRAEGRQISPSLRVLRGSKIEPQHPLLLAGAPEAEALVEPLGGGVVGLGVQRNAVGAQATGVADNLGQQPRA
jgi:hypothetical protein